MDILDVKDPTRGALGRADCRVIRDILLVENPANQLTSVAIGELTEIDFDINEFLVNCDARHRLNFVKFGLANCSKEEFAPKVKEFVAQLPQYVTPVVCAYADPQNADSPSIEAIIELATENLLPFVLVDTFEKSKGNFFDFVSAQTFKKLNYLAVSKGVGVAIAGSLRDSSLQNGIALSPKIIGVRGAACLY